MGAAVYRQIHTELWDDTFILDLTPSEKLLYIYLFSNSRTTMIGLYSISPRLITFHTGLDEETIAAALAKFEAAGKVYTEGEWVWIPTFLLRNCNNLRSPQVQTRIARTVEEIPPSVGLRAEWIRYYNQRIAPAYGIDPIDDTPLIPYQYPTDNTTAGSGSGSGSGSTPYGGASAHTPEEPEPPEPKPEEAEEKPARKPRARTAKEPKAPPPPAVEVYRAAMERYPAKTLWPGIVQVVGAEQASLDRWRKVLLAWLAMGWNKTNVKGPLGYFQRNEIPGDDGQTRGAVNHGAHRNSRRPASAEAIGKKTKSPEELRRELYPEKYGGSMPSLPGQGSATT